MKSSFDVPAAHSMDSSWYAVDEDGEVARFETYEIGALPTAAGVVEGQASVGLGSSNESLVQYLEATARARWLDADPNELSTILYGDAHGDSRRPFKMPPGRLETHVIVGAKRKPDDLGGLREVYHGNWWWGTSKTPLQENQLAQIAEWADHVIAEPIFDPDNGVTLFANQNNAPGEYVLEERPQNPIYVSELPSDVRAAVSSLVLPVKFSESTMIQLADFQIGEVQTWGDVSLRDDPDAKKTSVAEHAARLRALKHRLVLILALLAGFAILTWMIVWSR